MNMLLVKVVRLTSADRNNVKKFYKAGMEPGIYFVALTTEDSSYTKKLVVK